MAVQPLIVIVGPTASGKTNLAVEIAAKYNGEIICADSRTVYRGMDVGTAKPTAEERKRVAHWGLDLVNPGERFTAAQFKEYAVQKIAEIRGRGHVPFLVGGSGLYCDAVIFDYQFGSQADEDTRRKLEQLSLQELYIYCEKNNIKLPENSKNKRYVIRAIEQKSINTKRRTHPIENSFVVGITTDKSILRKRIEQRAEDIFKNGVIHEVKKLADKYGWNHESMTGNIYPLCRAHLSGELSLHEVQEKFIVQDWRLAKRQMTWFRRNPYIRWLPLNDAKIYIERLLDSEH